MNDSRISGFLAYKNSRYFKFVSALVILAILSDALLPVGWESFGGTWLGYTLGIISALIVLLLMGYGVAKRRGGFIKDTNVAGFRLRSTLQGWLSSHVYMGTGLIILATLHSGFQFGWNVHTLSYILMLLATISGFYGAYVYLRYPQLISQNMGDETLTGLRRKIAECDEVAREHALGLPDEINVLVTTARKETRLGGSLLHQLRGYQGSCPTSFAVNQLPVLAKKYTEISQTKLMRDLYTVLLQKEKLVLRARREIMLKARMQFWLYLHVPLSIALLAALFAHVVAILFYW